MSTTAVNFEVTNESQPQRMQQGSNRTQIAAIVPMRHNSERVKEKNFRRFADKPLYHRIIRALLESPAVSQVIIDTDSPTIMDDAAEQFPDVSIVERPEHLRAGETAMNDVLLNTVEQVKAEFYLQTHSTNPLLRSSTITRAVEAFLANHPMYDSLFGVTRLQTRLWDGLGQAVNHNPAILLRTQDLPPIYEENSNLYIFTREVLESSHNRIGPRPYLFEIDRLEAWDIDEQLDFDIAEFLFQKRQIEA